MTLEYWFLFPVGLLVASVAMSSGVGGSNFWIPIYLLWLRLEPRVAFWMSLLTMLFGFGSGVVRNWRAGTLDPALAGRYLRWAGPAAVIGALLSTRAPVNGLLLTFAAFVLVYSVVLWRRVSAEGDSDPAGPDAPPLPIRRSLALLAGGLQGTVATGSGTLLLPRFLDHRREAPATAIGTTVLMVFLLSLLSAVFRLDGPLLRALEDHRVEILSMIVFAAPGVVIGGQVGPRIARHLSRRWLLRYVSGLLLVVGVLVVLRVVG
jgi:hypothetical protein